MSEQNETLYESESTSKSEEQETTVWEPVEDDNEYNDYPLAFVNVDKETDKVNYNIDGEEVRPENLESPAPMIVGEFQGIKDISSEDNPEPSIKVLVESEDDERTYALNKVNALERQLQKVERGDRIGLDFEGYEYPDGDGLPWQNWKVYTPGN